MIQLAYPTQTAHERQTTDTILAQRIPASKQSSPLVPQESGSAGPAPPAACARVAGTPTPLVHTPRPRCPSPATWKSGTPLRSLPSFAASASPPRPKAGSNTLQPINDAASQLEGRRRGALEQNAPEGKPPAGLVPFPTPPTLRVRALACGDRSLPCLPSPGRSVRRCLVLPRGVAPRVAFLRGQCGYHFTRRPSVGSLGGTRRV